MVASPERRFRLLVADDDVGFRETIVDLLQTRFETIDAENGAEALEAAQEYEVHLVIFDMHMPILTGLEAIRQLKQRQEELPCILMTSDYTLELESEALDAHAHALLRKPVSRHRLLTTVTAALADSYPTGSW